MSAPKKVKTSNDQVINLKELLSVCYDLAKEAGEVIRKVMRSGELEVVDKADGKNPVEEGEQAEDPQTIADIRAQKLVTATIRHNFPSLRIVGEEGVLKTDESHIKDVSFTTLDEELSELPASIRDLSLKDVVVWVDPLDGTRGFANGETQAVTVLIGISYKKKSLAGVIHVPFSDAKTTIWGVASDDFKAYGGITPKTERDPEQRIISTSKSHMNEALQKLVDGMNPTKVIKSGGAGNKVIQVLLGNADAYVYPQNGTKKWDTAAPEAIARATGATCTDAYGVDLVYDADAPFGNVDGVLCTMKYHDSYLITESQRPRAVAPSSL